MRKRMLTISAMAGFMLVGCPAPYTELERSVEASAPADFLCLLEQMRDLADGRAVTYTVQDLSSGTAHNLRYLHSGWYYSWSMLVRPDQTARIAHGAGVKDSRPQDLPRVWHRLIEVEAVVRNQCELGDLMDTAQVSCRGKACKSAFWPPDTSPE